MHEITRNEYKIFKISLEVNRQFSVSIYSLIGTTILQLISYQYRERGLDSAGSR